MELIHSILKTLPSEADGCCYDSDMLVKVIDGKTPLCLAAEYGHEKIVSMFLDFGAAISQSDDEGRTALYLAAQNGHSGVVEQLLAAGADVNACAELKLLEGKSFTCRETHLHVAASSGCDAVIDVLLSASANVSARDDCGATPLHYAFLDREFSQEDVQSLIVRGSPPPTVLDVSIRAVVEKLLTAGADVNQQDRTGRTALHLAAGKSRHPKGLQQVLNGVYKIDDSLHRTLGTAGHQWVGAASIIPILLKAGSSVAIRDSQGETPLHKASENGQVTTVEILLAAGAEIDARLQVGQHRCQCPRCPIYGGYTALHLAATGNHGATVRTLCSAGASLSALTSSGETALSLAAALGYTNIVEILLAAGAAQTKVGLTAAEVKRERNYRGRVTSGASGRRSKQYIKLSES
jgi:ankyrin repeat protein